MVKNRKIQIAQAVVVLSVPLVLLSDPGGPIAGVTGAPNLVGTGNEKTCAQSGCHGGNAPLTGPGSVRINFVGTSTYGPNDTIRVQVVIADPNARRWGFQMTARSNNGKTQAGTFSPVDPSTQVICQNDSLRPSNGSCPASAPVEYIEHTLVGTQLGTTDTITFSMNWTAPSASVGNVDFYAAANAANGNNLADPNDRIYATSATLTPAASAPKPSIQSSDGVVNGASFTSGIAPNTWVTIRGANLASTTRTWAGSDFNGSNLPTALDGTSVKINGKDAFVYFISQTQLNVLAPANETSTGPVQVTVTAKGVTSDASSGQMQAVAPAFFQFNNGTDPAKYIAATHVDGTFTGPAGLYPSAPALTSPVKPGEVVVLYGTGFGQTNPAIPNGQIVTAPAPLVTVPTFTIGGTTIAPADVQFAGQSATGLYQFNVKVPDSAGNGDQKVVATVGGISTADAFIFVQK
jgi:uncharacterized protein (TIGR03437 family)